MKALKENTTETDISCAWTLSKLNRYSESVEYADKVIKKIEKDLGIDPKRPISEFKYQGRDRKIVE